LQANRVLAQLRERLRYLHYSLHEVEDFLTMLATARRCLPPPSQALSASLFVYKEVIDQQLSWLSEIGRPVPGKRIESVLSIAESERMLGRGR
jgi:DNA-binding transcriptional MerR regulator